LPALNKKVCLLGDIAVGKTSLVRRFLYNAFEERRVRTIGFKVSRKVVVVTARDDVAELAMIIWDLAGDENSDRVYASYLRGAAGAVLVCDLTQPKTLESLRAYAAAMCCVNPDARFVIAANKDDLTGVPQLSEEQVQRVANELHTACFFTSAKTGDAVEAVFRQLGRALVN
jgi:small GTP-binding protein